MLPFLIRAIELVPEVKAHLSERTLEILARKYDPNQPRVSAGNPNGGEWVGENEIIGRTITRQGDIGNDIYKIKNCSDLTKYNLICVSINGDDIYASHHYGNHNDILRAVDPNYSEDDYVRISVDNGVLVFHTEYAGIIIGGNFDKERAINNIYKTIDKLVRKGLPVDTKIMIYSMGESPIVTSAKSIETYDRQLWSYALDLYRTGDGGVFLDKFITAIASQLTRAWNEGAREVGVYPKEMTDDDRAELKAIIDGEYDQVIKLAEAIMESRSGTLDEFRQQFRNRIDLWVNRYTDVIGRARVYFGGKTRLKWTLGKTEEHCETCAALNGIVAFAYEWELAGIKPQSPPNGMLECGGWNCDCSLEVTDQRRSPNALETLMNIAVARNL